MPERPDDLTVVRLILARQRQLGASFDEAWSVALAAIPEFQPPDDRALNHAEVDRNDSLAALGRTREEWERAYRREPAEVPPSEAEKLAALLETVTPAEAVLPVAA